MNNNKNNTGKLDKDEDEKGIPTIGWLLVTLIVGGIALIAFGALTTDFPSFKKLGDLITDLKLWLSERDALFWIIVIASIILLILWRVRKRLKLTWSWSWIPRLFNSLSAIGTTVLITIGCFLIYWVAIHEKKKATAPYPSVTVIRAINDDIRKEGEDKQKVPPVFHNFPKGEWAEYKQGTQYRYKRGLGIGINMTPDDHTVTIRFEKIVDASVYSTCTFDSNKNAVYDTRHDDGFAFEEWYFIVSHDVRMLVR